MNNTRPSIRDSTAKDDDCFTLPWHEVEHQNFTQQTNQAGRHLQRVRGKSQLFCT